MSYSGANQARDAREALGKALEALQSDDDIPPDVLAVAQNIAQAVSALFEAERASSEPDGKSCVRKALGFLSQTLALLQDVRGEHKGIAVATEVLARSMSSLYPLTTVPSKAPPPSATASAVPPLPAPSPVPSAPAPPRPSMPLGNAPTRSSAPSAPSPRPSAVSAAPRPSAVSAPAAQPMRSGKPAPSFGAGQERQRVEANIGATTESNFYVGFSGEVAEGGVFLATYETFPKGTPVDLTVTLPGGFEMVVPGRVRFVRDPLDFSADSDPGMGIQFDSLAADNRELILRFIRKRPPIFYDD